jgi:DNA-binding CsgD family transcriptional regulator
MERKRYDSALEASDKQLFDRRQANSNYYQAPARIPGAAKTVDAHYISTGNLMSSEFLHKNHYKEAYKNTLSTELAYFIAGVNKPVRRGDIQSSIEAIQNTRLRVICSIIDFYIRGDYEQAKKIFLENKRDEALKICVSPTAIATAISTGDYTLFKEIESYLKNIVDIDISPEITAYAELALVNGYIGAGATNMVPGWLRDGDFSALQPQARLNATLMRALYYKWLGKTETMLALAQTALVLCSYGPIFTHEYIYLHILCAHGYIAQGQEGDAEKHLLEAMRVSLPQGITSPLAESLFFLGGVAERLMEKEFPQYYDAVIGQYKSMYVNWLAFHNQFANDSITLLLTLREYQIAMLVARRIPRTKIAKQFNISPGRLNNIIGEIYSKLCISSQKELSELVP